MFRKLTVTLPLLLGIIVWGCTSTTNDPFAGSSTETLDSASLSLSTEIIKDTDVEAIKFEVWETSCPGKHWYEGAYYKAVEDLKDFSLPTNIEPFMDAPFDEDSEHRFADHYFVLPAGCYKVKTTPLKRWGKPSKDCDAAWQKDVEVVDGETTEILLVNQCEGPEVGGLDVISVLNNPPTILDLTFCPNKFIEGCEGVVVCATATDPDGDPLEFTWELLAGPELLQDPIVVDRTEENGTVTECVLIRTTDAGEYNILVTIYDLVWDEGELIRVEEWLADQGYPNLSRDDMEFPIYASDDCDCEDCGECPECSELGDYECPACPVCPE